MPEAMACGLARLADAACLTVARRAGGAVPTTVSPTARAWRDAALCASEDPEVFFPDPSEPAVEALAVCFRCPVRLVCLAEALGRGERFGVWGGTTERVRGELLDGALGGSAALVDGWAA